MKVIADRCFLQNLRQVYISCKYSKFEKIHSIFHLFSWVIGLKGLIDELGELSILHASTVHL